MTKRYNFSRQLSRALVGSAAQSRRRAAARQKAAAAADRQREREAQRSERERRINAISDERARRQAYIEARTEEANQLTRDIEARIQEISSLLSASLDRSWGLDFERMKTQVTPRIFDPKGADKPIPKPKADEFRAGRVPLAGLFGSLRRRQEAAEAAAKQQYEEALDHHRRAEEERIMRLEAIRREHDEAVAREREEIDRHNQAIDDFQEQYKSGDPDAVVRYFRETLEDDELVDGLPTDLKIAFVPESRQLVIERDLPTIEVVPAIASHTYVKASDRMQVSERPTKHRQTLYNDLIAQITLRTLFAIVKADTAQTLDTIAFSGFVPTIDPATGKDIRPCVLTLRASREVVSGIDFRRVDPRACLNRLNAHVSRSAAELLPVRPVVDFNMVDKRFIDSTDVISELEDRPNLMELTPGEFENLITNLFSKLGLETRLTQASRDGGVDCVAWDLHPITGGKVIIQAKRYKHTVGVSAVRDLFGTVHNEGAGKGILVTTSGYGRAAYAFAENKPLELITGSNLLSLLEEHAGIRARIEMPDDWRDPEPDSAEFDPPPEPIVKPPTDSRL